MDTIVFVSFYMNRRIFYYKNHIFIILIYLLLQTIQLYLKLFHNQKHKLHIDYL